MYRLRPADPLRTLLRRLRVSTLTQLAWLPPWMLVRLAGQREQMERLRQQLREELGPPPEADPDLPWQEVLPYLPHRVRERLRLVGLFSVLDVLHVVEAGVLRAHQWLTRWELAALHDSLDAVGWTPALPVLEATPTPLAWPRRSFRLPESHWPWPEPSPRPALGAAVEVALVEPPAALPVPPVAAAPQITAPPPPPAPPVKAAPPPARTAPQDPASDASDRSLKAAVARELARRLRASGVNANRPWARVLHPMAGETQRALLGVGARSVRDVVRALESGALEQDGHAAQRVVRDVQRALCELTLRRPLTLRPDGASPRA